MSRNKAVRTGAKGGYNNQARRHADEHVQFDAADPNEGANENPVPVAEEQAEAGVETIAIEGGPNEEVGEEVGEDDDSEEQLTTALREHVDGLSFDDVGVHVEEEEVAGEDVIDAAVVDEHGNQMVANQSRRSDARRSLAVKSVRPDIYSQSTETKDVINGMRLRGEMSHQTEARVSTVTTAAGTTEWAYEEQQRAELRTEKWSAGLREIEQAVAEARDLLAPRADSPYAQTARHEDMQWYLLACQGEADAEDNKTFSRGDYA